MEVTNLRYSPLSANRTLPKDRILFVAGILGAFCGKQIHLSIQLGSMYIVTMRLSRLILIVSQCSFTDEVAESLHGFVHRQLI